MVERTSISMRKCTYPKSNFLHNGNVHKKERSKAFRRDMGDIVSARTHFGKRHKECGLSRESKATGIQSSFHKTRRPQNTITNGKGGESKELGGGTLQDTKTFEEFVRPRYGAAGRLYNSHVNNVYSSNTMEIETHSQLVNNQYALTVASWNARSIRNSFWKLDEVINHDWDIILIQETWLQEGNNIPNIVGNERTVYHWKRMDRKLGKNKAGGGTLILLKQGMTVIKEVRVGEDSGLYQVIFNTAQGTRTVWVCNVYLNKGSRSQIQTLFKTIEKVVPQDYVRNTFILGDFNVDLEKPSVEKDLICQLANSLGLRIEQSPTVTRGSASLDFLVMSKRGKSCSSFLDTILSDHKILVWRFEDINTIERKKILVINKKLSQEVSLGAVRMSKNSADFLWHMGEAWKKNKDHVYLPLNSRKMERVLFKRLVNSEGEVSNTLTLDYWRQMLEENEKQRFSQAEKQAFDFLQRVYKYGQYEKRDGSIVSKVKDGNIIITDEKRVNELLLQHLKSIQYNSDVMDCEGDSGIEFPKLKPLTKEEMRAILMNISTNKALAGDLVSDVILNGDNIDQTCEVLKDLWDGHQIDERHFKCRLIALNKKHPEIPSKDQYRPIIVSSLIGKILESRLVKPLRNYMTERLHVSQTGFVPGMNIR